MLQTTQEMPSKYYTRKFDKRMVYKLREMETVWWQWSLSTHWCSKKTELVSVFIRLKMFLFWQVTSDRIGGKTSSNLYWQGRSLAYVKEVTIVKLEHFHWINCSVWPSGHFSHKTHFIFNSFDMCKSVSGTHTLLSSYNHSWIIF